MNSYLGLPLPKKDNQLTIGNSKYVNFTNISPYDAGRQFKLTASAGSAFIFIGFGQLPFIYLILENDSR